MLSPTTDSASPSDGHRKVLVSLSNHQTLKFKANSFSLEGLQAKIEGLQSYGKFCETRVKRLETQRKQQQSKAKPRTNEACNSPFKIEGQVRQNDEIMEEVARWRLRIGFLTNSPAPFFVSSPGPWHSNEPTVGEERAFCRCADKPLKER